MESLVLTLAGVAAAVLIIAVVVWLAVRARRLPYRRVDSLLTAAERSFYGVLVSVVDRDVAVFPKVRLADLLWLPRDARDRRAHLNRVVSKHVDFVLCERRTLAPVLVIELDDSSHRARERRRRDAFVDQALRAAGLPLLRVPVRRSYPPHELADLIRLSLARRR
ncbi:MAG TPA: DUF2726 domain-containing protein [Dehalococcoidia bacterium]|nr:DUF2726 domain-containing protein [Dehalococcoidia bacterium]